jgi:hypothetical protein
VPEASVCRMYARCLVVMRGAQRCSATVRSESDPTSSRSGSLLRRKRVPQRSHSTTSGLLASRKVASTRIVTP